MIIHFKDCSMSTLKKLNLYDLITWRFQPRPQDLLHRPSLRSRQSCPKSRKLLVLKPSWWKIRRFSQQCYFKKKKCHLDLVWRIISNHLLVYIFVVVNIWAKLDKAYQCNQSVACVQGHSQFLSRSHLWCVVRLVTSQGLQFTQSVHLYLITLLNAIIVNPLLVHIRLQQTF